MSSSPPSAPDPAAAGIDEAATKTRKQRRNRRKFAGGLVLALGLVGAGFGASALTPQAQVATAKDDQAALVREGKQLYDTSCITCHGANLQGVQDRGPSLIGVGDAAVYFQVSTGRMPAAANGSQIARKDPKFDERAVDALSAYVAANGGGPSVPRDAQGNVEQESLIKDADIARGGELFRMNCASCHNFTGKGGALSSGKFAPPLIPPNEAQIYAAMLTGPQNMPKFSDREITPEEKRDIIAYVKDRTESLPEAGYGLGGFGPATEGLAIFVVGVVVLVGSAMWIGSKS
ncbi:cytochrome bc1 complex diheme cytochrome c subunit [Nocardia stercoris]|uniref:Cytochrome bc1 complex cytochrome c subunit n=1 Tax=Nocardia stercoris TaxID=2483361 RepID=A0A3M2KTW9_9NOCA|nr:cytochrome c [Nocardia stercoris]RMI29092.1 cytochrome C [Nocardia stercoris]